MLLNVLQCSGQPLSQQRAAWSPLSTVLMLRNPALGVDRDKRAPAPATWVLVALTPARERCFRRASPQFGAALGTAPVGGR